MLKVFCELFFFNVQHYLYFFIKITIYLIIFFLQVIILILISGVYPYIERKKLSLIQRRCGPQFIGLNGRLQFF